MTTENGVASLPPPSPHRSLPELSPSNLSSPLSDVEEKDAEGDDAEFGRPNRNSSPLSNVILEDNEVPSAFDTRSGSEHDDSNLSDVEMNDSEAETERLYSTPPKQTLKSERANSSARIGRRHLMTSRDRVFEPGPSNPKQQVHAHAHAIAEHDAGREDLLSDGDDEGAGDDDHASDTSGDSALHGSVRRSGRVSILEIQRETEDSKAKGLQVALTATSRQRSISGGRKRKRSPTADQSESDQPLRKRPGAVPIAVHNSLEESCIHGKNGEETSAIPPSGDRSGTEEERSAAIGNDGTRKSKRSDARMRKSPGLEDGVSEANEDELDAAEMAPAEEGPMQAAREEQIDADVDEEAELLHKNEEELERKKAAFEQLQTIEQHFFIFRDKLYEERLSQLNEEEAMLTSDHPTHPEYLAMMECIDARRDEKVRVINLEIEFNTGALKAWAVARRGQIHGQFFQSIRESRDSVLEELGGQWYKVQQQRRRHANTIPDYGLRYPSSRAQRMKDAVAYNKEVSILSGIAKHEGFPAAPLIRGASANEIEEDFEEMARARQSSYQQASISTSFPEIGGLSFSLGAAGQQYLADTPWANPNHPSHHAQRQQSQQHRRTSSPLSGQFRRRHSQQLGGLFSLGTGSISSPVGDLTLAEGQKTHRTAIANQMQSF